LEGQNAKLRGEVKRMARELELRVKDMENLKKVHTESSEWIEKQIEKWKQRERETAKIEAMR